MKKKLKNKIKSKLKPLLDKLVNHIISEIKRKEKLNSNIIFNKVKKGKDSFFWGTELSISSPEKITLGENVHIGNNAFIKAEGGLSVGDNTHISRNLVLYTINHNYNSDILPYNNEFIKKEVVIGKNVWIGMNVCITPGTIIGDGVIIGMGTVVSGNVPPLSIVGSEKFKILKNRDKELYKEVDEKGRYGKENGLLYIKKDVQFKTFGDKTISDRTIVEIIEFENKKAVKKSYMNSKEGVDSYKNELDMYSLFEGYSWLPKILSIASDYLIFEFIDNKYRLDQYIDTVAPNERLDIFGEIIFCLIEIYSKNIAHCDFHAKNIFYTPDGIKIIDFETSQKLNSNIDFFESYDVTGKFLESPFLTKNMCVLGHSDFSLKKIFNIRDENHFKELFDSFLKEKLYKISGSFFTRKQDQDARHTLVNRYIYATFNLKHLQIDEKIGQRNIKKRLENFNITKKDIHNKNILDIGSNIGALLSGLMEYEPSSALGIEYDNDKVQISNIIKSLHFKDKELSFKRVDVESTYFKSQFNTPYDIVFCLAVLGHLKDKDAFFKKLNAICLKTLYFEGNSNTNVDYIKENLVNNGFKKVEYLGLSDDELNIANNKRPLFVAHK